MYKRLSLAALIVTLTLLPGFRCCKKNNTCKPCKQREEKKVEQKVDIEMAGLTDLYDDTTEEQLKLAQAELENALMELKAEIDAPRKM